MPHKVGELKKTGDKAQCLSWKLQYPIETHIKNEQRYAISEKQGFYDWKSV
jgi:hypothetical protein